MKKLLLTLLLLSGIIYAATPEQVERYLMLSHAEDDLLELESSFGAMQNRMDAKDGNGTTYDTEMLTIRFREKLQQSLSDSEMDKVLENYKNETLLKFVYESSDPEGDYLEIQKYAKEAKANPELKSRLEIIQKINKYYSNEEAISQMFDTLMLPIFKRIKPEMDDKNIKEMRKRYLKSMAENGYNQILYATREFETQELDALLEIAKTPAMGYEVKAISAAMSYAMEEFMTVMANRMGHKKR